VRTSSVQEQPAKHMDGRTDAKPMRPASATSSTTTRARNMLTHARGTPQHHRQVSQSQACSRQGRASRALRCMHAAPCPLPTTQSAEQTAAIEVHWHKNPSDVLRSERQLGKSRSAAINSCFCVPWCHTLGSTPAICQVAFPLEHIETPRYRPNPAFVNILAQK
jgi:hypothetical protein